jgi:serine/threonine protein kinase
MDYLIKFIDFGLSKQIELIFKSIKTQIGILEYINTEIFLEKLYFYKSDISSFRCVIYINDIRSFFFI